ncbi:MAG TPA: histidine kinase N-terminal 7TM domain-containing protein [Anaerolineae bacterium]|nr:histidine kinase N-terminal 7TM domain-containing protein [Anaerolineae bacterium]
MQGVTLTGVLSLGNLILSATNVIVAFSLLVYILSHNLRSSVARAFCALLAFVTVVHAADVILINVQEEATSFMWLKFQWLGIAFIPAAYLQFSDAVLRTTNSFSRLRRGLVVATYLFGTVLVLLTVSTSLLVRDGVDTSWAVYFQAGPLFWVFSVYFFLVTAMGVLNIERARRRTVTSTSRRRMTYLAVSFAAPALGVFPYMLLASLPDYFSANPLLFIVLVGNLGIALMTVILAYSVAFYGALTPDRVVKRSLVNYLLRGPLVGICLLALMLVVPRVESILGLPRDTVLVFAVIVGIVVLQVLISLAAPFVDLLIYRRDSAEITWIRELDTRLLTTTDLSQLLENILAAFCDLLRAESGFVVTKREGMAKLQAVCGPRMEAKRFVRESDLEGLAQLLAEGNGEGPQQRVQELFSEQGDYWLLPLRARSREQMLGILGVTVAFEQLELTERENEIAVTLINQAALALEDWQLQRGIFTLLWELTPEIESIQRWQSHPRYVGSPMLEPIEHSPVHAPDFPKVVKEALSHYWGGPGLTESPLLRMKIVRRYAQESGQVPTKALRSVLYKAIEALKPPEGKRTLTTKEWILYNILEMKFIRGLRIIQIATRLSMSESDLYRKQRAAIDAVAKVLASMEEDR